LSLAPEEGVSNREGPEAESFRNLGKTEARANRRLRE
jgi:hypothetical protein